MLAHLRPADLVAVLNSVLSNLRYRTDRLPVEDALKRAGLIHSDHNPHRANVSDDVMLSLRYMEPGHHHDLIDPIDEPSAPWWSSADVDC